MDAAKIRIAVEANSSGVTAGLAPGLAALSNFERQATGTINKLQTSFAGLSTAQKAIGGIAVGVGVLGLAFAQTLKPAIEFESAFTGVLKTVDGSTSQLAALRSDILDMASAMPVAATEIAGVAEAAGQLGIATPDIAAFTETMIMLGTATDLSATQAATAFAQMANVMQIPTSDIDNLGASLVALGNSSATTESQILFMSQSIAGAGQILGITGDEVLAISAAVASTGIEVEAGGSAISRVFLDMKKAVSEGGESLDLFAKTAGLTSEAFQELVQGGGGAEAFSLFVSGLADAGDDALVVLDQLGLDGIRVGRVLLNLAGSGDLLTNSLNTSKGAFESNTALMDEYARFTQTAAAQIEIFQGKIQNLAIAVGSAGLPLLTEAFEAAGRAVEFLGEALGPVFSELGTLLGNVGSAAATAFEVFGGPVLGIAAAALVGMASGLEAVLATLNAIGPVAAGAFALLVADILLVGPASLVATGGLSALTGGLSATAIAVRTMSVAMAAAPWAILIAGAALVGKALIDAGAAADVAAEAVSGNLAEAISSADFSGLEAEIASVRDRMLELQQIDTVSDGLGGGWESWGTAIKSVGQILTPFTENTVVNARAELEALDGVMQTTSADVLAGQVDLLSTRMGLSGDVILAYGNELGNLGLLLDGSAEGFFAFEAAVAAHHDSLLSAGQAAGVSADAFTDLFAAFAQGQGSAEQIGEVFGTTAETVYRVAEAAGVAADDLPGMALAMASAVAEAEPLARALGTTGGAALEAATNLLNLTGAVGAFNDVLSGIEGRTAALEQVIQATDGMAQAQVRFNEALDSGDIQGAAEAMRDYSTNAALAGEPIDEIARSQERMSEQIRETGAAAGEASGHVENLITVYGTLSDAEIIELKLEGTDALVEAAAGLVEVRDGLNGLDGETFIAEMAVELGTTKEDVAELILSGDAWNDARFIAAFEAVTETERAEEAMIMLAAFDGFVAEAEVEAEVDPADIGKLERAKSLIDSIQSKTVTVGVNVTGGGGYGSYNTGAFQANGSIMMANGGITRFSSGGMSPIQETPGTAKIYSPTTQFRVFAEPETGGEAYIPLALGKRARSRSIWAETGRRLGMMADGGIQAFNGGGITAGVFQSSGGLPSIQVQVAIDTEGIGSLNVPLDALTRSLGDVERNAGLAVGEVGNLSDSLVELGNGGALGLEGVVRSVEQFKTSFSDVGATAEETGRRMLEAMRPEQFLDVFTRISGWARDSFVEWLGDWDGTVEQALQKLSEAGLEMGHIFEGVTEDAVATGRDLYTVFQDAGVEMSQAMQDAGRDMAEAIDPALFAAVFERITGDAVADILELEGAWEGTTSEMIRELERAGVDLDGIFERIFEEGASNVDVFEAAMVLAGDAVSDLESDIRVLDDAMSLLHGGFLGVVEATNDVAIANERLDKAVEDLAENTNATDADMARFVDTLIRTGEEYYELAVATAESGGGIEAVNKVLAEGEEKLRAAGEAAGLSAGQIDALVEALLGVPPEVITEIAVEGEAAQEKIDEIKLAMEVLETFDPVITISADGTAAVQVSGEVQAALQVVADGVYEALMTADSTGAITDADAMRARLEEVVNAAYVAVLDADPTQAELAAGAAQAAADAFAIAFYEATLNGDPEPAKTAAEAAAKAATDYANDNYEGTMDGNAQPAIEAAGLAKGEAEKYVNGGPYKATIDADTPALAKIERVAGALSGLSDKTVTVTTNQVTNVSVKETLLSTNAGGGMHENGVRTFAHGDVRNGHQPEMAAGGAWRLWAEPETQGESYIPHANDWRRPRAISILEQTANKFGMGLHKMNAGGVLGRVGGGQGLGSTVGITQSVYSLSVSPGAVVVEINGTNMSASEVERISGRQVEAGLRRVVDDLTGGFAFAR